VLLPASPPDAFISQSAPTRTALAVRPPVPAARCASGKVTRLQASMAVAKAVGTACFRLPPAPPASQPPEMSDPPGPEVTSCSRASPRQTGGLKAAIAGSAASTAAPMGAAAVRPGAHLVGLKQEASRLEGAPVLKAGRVEAKQQEYGKATRQEGGDDGGAAGDRQDGAAPGDVAIQDGQERGQGGCEERGQGFGGDGRRGRGE